MVLLAGGLLAGGVAGSVLSIASTPQTYELDQVSAAELDGAKQSFPPAELATHIEDAKACRTPITFVTLKARGGSTGRIRIRSGDYWTPTIRLGAEPLRVALPYPAPYPSARGDFQFESDGAAFDVFLRPGWASGALQGTATVHVWWRPKSPC